MMLLKYDVEKMKFSDLRGKIEIPKFQRGLVWSQGKKEEFIKTLKAGLPIGVLLLSKKGDKYLVIDGLQRYSTMVDYSNDYFKYISRDEIDTLSLMNIVLSSNDASTYYNLYTTQDQERILNDIRSVIVNFISKVQEKNINNISWDITECLCEKISILPNKDDRKIQQAVYSIVDGISQRAQIGDVEIPLIIFNGDDNELANIFQKLNQEGVKLSKYDVFAATWINHTVKVINDPDFIDLIIKKYEIAQKESGLDISEYDPDVIKQKGELTVFEYAFGLGKALAKSCQKLFPKSDESKIDSIGFLILAELLGLSYQKMGDLAERIQDYTSVDYKALKDAIVDSCKQVENALAPYITSPAQSKGKTVSLVYHSDLQIVSYIIVSFKLQYELSTQNGLVKKKNIKYLKDFKQYLHKHYLFDIMRGFWSGSGDSKLEDIIENLDSCRYLKDVNRESFEQVVRDWLHSANEKHIQKTVTAEAKLFLNYLLRGRVFDADKREYDIEHCVPQKVLQDYLIKKGVEVPVSSVCNLVYIPASENRSKGEYTYYQKQDKDTSSYTLDKDALDKLLYPRRDELKFVESSDTITESNYLQFLHDRETIILGAFIAGYYHV
jgi:hypothetical protein